MVLRIRKPRTISTTQLIVVSVVGVLAGAYIWQPLFVKYRENSESIKKMESLKTIKKSLNSSPGIMFAGIAVSGTIIFGYRYLIKPTLDYRRRVEAESFANFIFEKENEQLSKSQ
ncbi:uncharacterized protein LOC129615892 [Condylostylus longicornis]|uniref:uncharacterized protein LOC129615892 n=1 Tax=Condylostylus longicornis TaxID=2530218 RepID=UPI00244DA5F6|nr:uncharacterized protein LOC129615892 [Condylostylus longicornis]